MGPDEAMNIGQLVRWVNDLGARPRERYGRVREVQADGYTVATRTPGRAGRPALVEVEQVEAVHVDDLEQVEAWLESGVD